VTDSHRDEVGSLGEEAAKLLGALSVLALDHGSASGEGLLGPYSQAAGTANDVAGHLATGVAECTVCPLCCTMSTARHVSPEVTTHLSAAAATIAQVASALFPTGRRSPRHTSDGANDARANNWSYGA
jgi:hypothetical protein